MGENKSRIIWSGVSVFTPERSAAEAYEATATQAETADEAADARSLLVKFDTVEDADLYTMANDDQAVRARIDAEHVPESTLKALANTR